MFDLVIKNALIADGTGQPIYKGEIADLVIFSPVRICETNSFKNPHSYPDGIDYVIVNGKTVIDHGEHTGIMPGIILRKA